MGTKASNDKSRDLREKNKIRKIRKNGRTMKPITRLKKRLQEAD